MSTKTMTMQEFYEKDVKEAKELYQKQQNEIEKDYRKITEKIRNISPESPAWSGWW